MTWIKNKVPRLLFWVVLTLLFSIAVGGFSILYTSNQTAYFAYGLADGGLGNLSADWFANTQDPFPVFSFLVKNTYRYLGESFFYVYQFVLNGIFLFSMIGILDHFYHFRKTRFRYLAFTALYIVTFSPMWPVDSQKTLYEGVANQFIGFSGLLPNSFGVFLFLSVYLYLKQKPVWSVVSLVVAGYFHTGLLLCGAVLVLGYMVNEYLAHKYLKRALMFGGGAFVLVLPIAVYYYLANSNAAPDQVNQAAHILANIRITQHAQVTEWWGMDAVIKFLIMLGAMVAAYRTKLFPVIVLGFFAIALPSLAVVLRPSNTVSTLQIWRVSVFIVPLSSSVIFGRLAAQILPQEGTRISGWKLGYILLLLAVGLVYGVRAQLATIQRYETLPSRDLMDFVQSHGQPGDVYLVPPHDTKLERFRFETGMPIYVNWKGFPWNTLDALEWYDRIQQADRIYQPGEIDACNELSQIQAVHGITHVVTAADTAYRCAGTQIYQGEHYQVFQLSP